MNSLMRASQTTKRRTVTRDKLIKQNSKCWQGVSGRLVDFNTHNLQSPFPELYSGGLQISLLEKDQVEGKSQFAEGTDI